MAGWIKAHRAIQEHWIFADAEKYRAWMIILFTVNFEPKKVNIKNTVFECKRGESLLSLDSWAKLFGKNWNKSKVRRFFVCLESDSMIVTKSEHKTTRLTVCNYDTYQDERNANETKVKRKRNANETQTTPTKEGKEREEVKNDKNNVSAKRFLPPTQEEIKAYCIERKNKVDPVKFFNHYEANGWMRGKSKIKKWKACIITWEKNEQGSSGNNSNQKSDIKNAGKFDPNEKY